MLEKFKIIFFIFLFIFFSLDKANAITFNDYYELSNCVENFDTLKQFKNKIKTCFKDKNIILNDEAINKIKDKDNVLNKLIGKEINRLLETNTSVDDIFSKPTVFSPDYYLDDKNLEIIIKYAIYNPTLIYAVTRDINNLAFIDQIISLSQRENALLKIYNSLNINLFVEVPKKAESLKITEKPKKKIEKIETPIKSSKPTLLEKLKEIIDPDSTEDKPKIKEKKIASLPEKKKDKKKKITNPKPHPSFIFALPLLALAGGGGGGGSGSSSPPTLSYSVSSKSLGECDSAATVTGTLTSAHSSNVTVLINTSGTATNGVDYNLSSTTLTINAGSTSATISVTPVNDTTVETSETIILTASVTGGGVSTTGNTVTTVTLYDYVLKCNSTAFTDQGTSTTMAARDEFENVDSYTGSPKIHPFELLNIHKAHAYNNGTNSLDGTGITIHVNDFNCDSQHTEFSGKTITQYLTFDDDSANDYHCNLVAGIAAGAYQSTSGTTGIMGVAYNSDLVLSPVPTPSGTNKHTHKANSYDHARTNGATVSNNSWGSFRDNCNDINNPLNCVDANSGVNVSEMSTLITNNSSQSQEETMAAYLTYANATNIVSANTTGWNDLIQALDDFQTAGGIFVFATGNSTNESDVGVYAGLPNFYSQLEEAWLAVGYVDVTGASNVSSITTSNVSQQGNVCGSAKEYCLVADAVNLYHAHWYDDASSTSNYKTISGGGSSSASPMVSGILALLQQAFPNHTPEQIVDRLLASAKNDWFTPSGNTTFTTHGASIKHGYHNTWGHGFPDAYAALSPITTSSNPLSFVSGGGGSGGGGSSGSGGSGGSVPFTEASRMPVSTTSMIQSSLVGNSIRSGLAGKTTYAYDALNGGFKYDLSNLIIPISFEDQKIEIDFDKELTSLRNLDSPRDKFLNKQYYNGEFVSFKDDFNQGLSLTLGQPNIALQNFNLYNNDYYKNPYTSYSKGMGINNKFNLLGNDIFFGYHKTSIDPLLDATNEKIIPTENLTFSMNFDNDNFDLLSFTTGFLKEENSFLLSQGFGALGTNNSDSLSKYYGLNISKNLNQLGDLYFSSMIGFAKLKNPNNYFITDASDVMSSSFEMNYELKDILEKDVLNISLSQPQRVEKGDMTFRVAGLADYSGNIPFYNHVVDLSPSGRQIDLSIGYYTKHSDYFKTGIKTIITDDLGHQKSNDLNSNILFSASYIF